MILMVGNTYNNDIFIIILKRVFINLHYYYGHIYWRKIIINNYYNILYKKYENNINTCIVIYNFINYENR